MTHYQVVVLVPFFWDFAQTEPPREVDKAARKLGIENDYFEEAGPDNKFVYSTEDQAVAHAFANEVRRLGFRVEV